MSPRAAEGWSPPSIPHLRACSAAASVCSSLEWVGVGGGKCRWRGPHRRYNLRAARVLCLWCRVLRQEPASCGFPRPLTGTGSVLPSNQISYWFERCNQPGSTQNHISCKDSTFLCGEHGIRSKRVRGHKYRDLETSNPLHGGKVVVPKAIRRGQISTYKIS